MLLFSQCHAVFNSAQVVKVAEADSLGKLYYVCGSVTHHPFVFIRDTIGLFLAFYRRLFPAASVLPKMHFLEDHAVPFILKWRTGFGFLGEQGGEAVHAAFNSLQRIYNNIPNRVEQLHCMMKEHHLRLCPENIQEKPAPPKKQKLE